MKIRKLEWKVWPGDRTVAEGLGVDYTVWPCSHQPCLLFEDGEEAGSFDTTEEALEEAQARYEQDARYFFSQHTEE